MLFRSVWVDPEFIVGWLRGQLCIAGWRRAGCVELAVAGPGRVACPGRPLPEEWRRIFVVSQSQYVDRAGYVGGF